MPLPDARDGGAMEARDAALVKVLEETDALTAYVSPWTVRCAAL